MSKEEWKSRERYKALYHSAIRYHIKEAPKKEEKRKKARPCLKCESNESGYCLKFKSWCNIAREGCYKALEQNEKV